MILFYFPDALTQPVFVSVFDQEYREHGIESHQLELNMVLKAIHQEYREQQSLSDTMELYRHLILRKLTSSRYDWKY